MSYSDNQVQSRGYGNWMIFMHKDAGYAPPSIQGELLIDSSKYTIVKHQSRDTIIMIVPAGNVAFAINIDEASRPIPVIGTVPSENIFKPRDIDRR